MSAERQPYTQKRPCPVCNGHRDLPRGKGQRCHGYTVEIEGKGFAFCSREEHAGRIAIDRNSGCYPHRLAGECKCGVAHGAAVHAIGEASRRIEAVYDYTDAEGALVYQVVRFHPKNFRQRRPDGAGGWAWNLGDTKPLLYRLPEVVAAVAAGDPVYIVEGEKDVDSLRRVGVVATCNSGGAGKWPSGMNGYLAGANVVIVRDKDDAGTAHARDVFANLRAGAQSIRVVEARRGKDATDHLGHGLGVADFVPVWPVEDLRLADPAAWKRRLLRLALDTAEPFRLLDPHARREVEPTWPCGLEGESLRFSGVVIVSGAPSSGKSVLALGSSVAAARAGFDVLYLSAEMPEVIAVERLRQHCGDEGLPESLRVVDVSYGANIETLMEFAEERVGARPTLIVFDSVSSFVDQAEIQNENDLFGMAPLRRLVMWAINARRASGGQLAFLLLSEVNREGRAKGRMADHRADLALAMESDKDYPAAKNVRVTKGWTAPVGEVGRFLLDVGRWRLSRV